MDRDIIRENFTIAELKAIESESMKRVLASLDFYKNLPLGLVCANPSTPWFVSSILFALKKRDELTTHLLRFPPIPTLLKWATRWWFARRYSSAWEFGPMDLWGNEKIISHP